MAVAKTVDTGPDTFGPTGGTGVITAGGSFNLTGCTWVVAFLCVTSGHAPGRIWADAAATVELDLVDSAADTVGESGVVYAYFKNITGHSLGTVTPRMTDGPLSAGNWSLVAVAGTGTAPEVYATGLVKEQENQALTEENVDDGSPGTNSLRVAGVYYGAINISSTPGANTTNVAGSNTGTASWAVGHESAAGQGSRPVGYVNVTADDVAALYFAIRESLAGGPSFMSVIVGL